MTFAINADNFTDENPNSVYVIGADGRAMHQLVCGAFGADWSPSGTRIAYVALAPDGLQLTIMDLLTGRTTPILRTPPDAIDRDIVWRR